MPVSPSPLRLYVSHDLGEGQNLTLSPDQSRYVAQVMRRKAGDEVLLFNGRHGEWLGTLERLDKKSADVEVTSLSRAQNDEPALWLLFAPVKRTATDFIIQKATELGVTRLVPVITAHTNVDRVKVDRLTAIATEAAEQCRRMTVPDVEAPIALSEVIADWPNDVPLYLLDETGEGAPIAQVLGDLGDQESGGGAFVMGPEGGFAESELDLMRALPFSTVVSLGPRILRAETAALAALTCWQAICGDWRNSIG